MFLDIIVVTTLEKRNRIRLPLSSPAKFSCTADKEKEIMKVATKALNSWCTKLRGKYTKAMIAEGLLVPAKRKKKAQDEESSQEGSSDDDTSSESEAEEKEETIEEVPSDEVDEQDEDAGNRAEDIEGASSEQDDN